MRFQQALSRRLVHISSVDGCVMGDRLDGGSRTFAVSWQIKLAVVLMKHKRPLLISYYWGFLHLKIAWMCNLLGWRMRHMINIHIDQDIVVAEILIRF